MSERGTREKRTRIVDLLPAWRAGAVCNAARIAGRQSTRLSSDGCMGTAGKFVWITAAEPPRTVSSRPDYRSGASVDRQFARLRVGCSVEAAYGLAFDPCPHPLVPAERRHLPFELSVISCRFSANSFCVQLCGPGHFPVREGTGLENCAWSDRSRAS